MCLTSSAPLLLLLQDPIMILVCSYTTILGNLLTIEMGRNPTFPPNLMKVGGTLLDLLSMLVMLWTSNSSSMILRRSSTTPKYILHWGAESESWSSQWRASIICEVVSWSDHPLTFAPCDNHALIPFTNKVEATNISQLPTCTHLIWLEWNSSLILRSKGWWSMLHLKKGEGGF